MNQELITSLENVHELYIRTKKLRKLWTDAEVAISRKTNKSQLARFEKKRKKYIAEHAGNKPKKAHLSGAENRITAEFQYHKEILEWDKRQDAADKQFLADYKEQITLLQAELKKELAEPQKILREKKKAWAKASAELESACNAVSFPVDYVMLLPDAIQMLKEDLANSSEEAMRLLQVEITKVIEACKNVQNEDARALRTIEAMQERFACEQEEAVSLCCRYGLLKY